MDLYVAFMSMVLLGFGIAALGLGIFTTYFGAGKSRAIGVILGLIGIVVLMIFYGMTIDHFGYGWVQDDVSDSFLGVIGMLIGVVLSIVLVIGLMMVIKEDEPEVPGIDDWKKDLEVDDSEDMKTGDDEEVVDGSEIKDEEDGIGPDDMDAVSDDPIADETEEEAPGEEPADDPGPEDDMSDFLKDKEEKKIVKEDWEKVDEDGHRIPAPDDEEDPPAPEDETDDDEPPEPDGDGTDEEVEDPLSPEEMPPEEEISVSTEDTANDNEKEDSEIKGGE